MCRMGRVVMLGCCLVSSVRSFCTGVFGGVVFIGGDMCDSIRFKEVIRKQAMDVAVEVQGWDGFSLTAS